VRCILVLFVLCAIQTAAIAQAALSSDRRQQAETIWNRYVSLEAAFDPALADLYADDALIQNRRTYPTGETRLATVPATTYKQLVRKAIPVAKAQNDVSRYSNCRFMASEQADRVRIICERYSVLKDYTSPIALLVGPGPAGAWLIHEELSESRP
jgi:hypothetical protein